MSCTFLNIEWSIWLQYTCLVLKRQGFLQDQLVRPFKIFFHMKIYSILSSVQLLARYLQSSLISSCLLVNLHTFGVYDIFFFAFFKVSMQTSLAIMNGLMIWFLLLFEPMLTVQVAKFLFDKFIFQCKFFSFSNLLNSKFIKIN